MEHYKEVIETKEVVRKIHINTTCDRCDSAIPKRNLYDCGSFGLEWTNGKSYGNDGGYEEGWSVEDICEDYARLLYKLLKDNGFKITIINRDW